MTAYNPNRHHYPVQACALRLGHHLWTVATVAGAGEAQGRCHGMAAGYGPIAVV